MKHVTETSIWTTNQAAPDLRAILDRRTWEADAACAGSDIHFPDEKGLAHGNIASGAQLLPLLICGRCPVRRRCLEAAFETWTFSHTMSRQSLDKQKVRPQPDAISQAWNWGIWGGSTEVERWALRSLPVDEQAAILESTFEARLEARIAAWRKTPRGKGGRRITELLASRELRFHKGGRGGPGRGHKGPVALLAGELKCSRMTAWRRLHAAA